MPKPKLPTVQTLKSKIGIPSHISVKRIGALVISLALSPTLLFWVLALLSIIQTPWPSTGLRRTWLHTIVWINFVLSAFYGLFLVTRGITLDADLHHPSVKRSRLLFIAPITMIYIVETIWLYWLNAPQPVTSIFLSIAAVLTIFSIISYFWKISHHMEGITTFSFGMLALFGGVSAWILALIPLVAWARLRLNRHTPKQILAGIIIPTVIVVPILW